RGYIEGARFIMRMVADKNNHTARGVATEAPGQAGHGLLVVNQLVILTEIENDLLPSEVSLREECLHEAVQQAGRCAVYVQRSQDKVEDDKPLAADLGLRGHMELAVNAERTFDTRFQEVRVEPWSFGAVTGRLGRAIVSLSGGRQSESKQRTP